jgi:hypothetical protein
VRQIAAKATILLLAIIIAAVLIAPQVDLDPAAPRLEWAACLLMVFLSWLAALTISMSTAIGITRLRADCFPLDLTPIPPASSRTFQLLC